MPPPAARPMGRRDHYICAALAGVLGSATCINGGNSYPEMSPERSPADAARKAIEYAEATMREADRSTKRTGE